MLSDEDYRKRFGTRLFRLRREAGLPQHAVGDHVGVSHAAVQQWEIGKTTPTAGKRQKLADLFQASFDDEAVLAEPLLSTEEKPMDGRKLPRVSSLGGEVDREKAARLRQARESAGYTTAAKAAAEIGTPYSTYAGHESAIRGFKRAETVRYAEAFGVTPEWIEFGTGAAEAQKRRVSGRSTGGSVRAILESQKGALSQDIAFHKEMAIKIQGELDVVISALEHLDRVEAGGAS